MRPTSNPFYVLELAPHCSRAEVERAGQKLLAMLELDLGGADRYDTPNGSQTRDAAVIREAMAQLRDPQRRLFHELWAVEQPWANAASPVGDLAPGFGDALAALGWR